MNFGGSRMGYDMVIRGGTVVDGTGAAARTADVAVQDGRIVGIGQQLGRGAQEIDADGLLVTPGFVDIHTHLDAQVGWDPLLTPVSWHGVTTALMGNCGVTFAPCRPADRELLAGMMETVENIPREAILGGLPWDWEGYGGYLDAVERLQPALNIAGMVGHCAVRFYVMGERAVAEPATAAERQQIAALVARSVDEGAVGFSSNRFPNHVLPDGRSIPGTFAEHEEMLEIARALAPRDALMQNVMDFGRKELGNDALLMKLAETTGGRVLFSYGAGASADAGARAAAFVDQLTQAGRDITALSIPRGSGFVFGLQGSLPAYDVWNQRHWFGPTWEWLAGHDLAGRLRAIQDADVCAKLVHEARYRKTNGEPRDERTLPWLQHGYWMGGGDSPVYTAHAARNVLALAAEAGEHWSETFLRLSRESGGRGMFTWRMYNQNLEALGDLLRNPRVIPGLSDAGAHVSQVMDCGVSTFILSYWVKQAGLYSLEEGVKRLTSAPARVVGLKDRGVLAPGMRADINVIDLARLGERQPELLHDFPGGAPRYVQRATGYVATLVNGAVAVRNDEHTGARAGAVLRHRR
jgi:N-acyl-D-aspartate/D-glutamate deacylase